MSVLALRGGTIYPDPRRDAIPDGVVIIEGARVAAVGRAREVLIPPNAHVVECGGASVVHGFWNSHVHLTERKWSDAADIPAAELDAQLAEFTRYGFTSLFDLSSSYANTESLRRRIAANECDGPSIATTGEGIVARGSAPPELVSRMMGWMPVALHEIGDAADAARAARELVEKGVDGIKVFGSGQNGAVVAEASMRAVVEVAHARALPVFVHPNASGDVRRAVAAGVDVVAHTLAREAFASDEIARMAERGVALIPTLALWKHLARHDRASAQRAAIECALAHLAGFRAAGGTVIFGTDHGAVDPDPSEEYRLMRDAGMDYRAILASLTAVPSKLFTKEAGSIEPGGAADLVVLDGDIARNVEAFANVRATVRAGRVIYRADASSRSQ